MNAELLVIQAAQIAGLPGASVMVDGVVQMTPAMRSFLQILSVFEGTGELSLRTFERDDGLASLAADGSDC